MLIQHPAATFFVRVTGNSLGLQSEDILIVDRALKAHHNSTIIVRLEGELLVKRLVYKQGKTFLVAETIAEITEETDFEVWGVVTSVIHRLS